MQICSLVSKYGKLIINEYTLIILRHKSYYATTPIFYVNASPHIGHLYTATLADTICRWKAFKGFDARLVSGTDEHGLKVAQAAKNSNLDNMAYCNKVSLR